MIQPSIEATTPPTGHRTMQVGYISEYPHALAPGTPVSAGPDGVSLDALFWGGKATELEGGRRVIGQVWPSVRNWLPT
jgi:hypothetical protein